MEEGLEEKEREKGIEDIGTKEETEKGIEDIGTKENEIEKGKNTK